MRLSPRYTDFVWIKIRITHVHLFWTRKALPIEDKSINIEYVWQLIDNGFYEKSYRAIRISKIIIFWTCVVCVRNFFLKHFFSRDIFSLPHYLFFVSVGALMVWLCVQRYANLFCFFSVSLLCWFLLLYGSTMYACRSKTLMLFTRVQPKKKTQFQTTNITFRFLALVLANM